MTTAAILCIGDELLDGRVVDANARFFIQWASDHAVDVREVRMVGDDTDAICAALQDLCANDVIVVSGGLGPTEDDRTRQAASKFADAELVEDNESLQRLKDRFERFGATFTENNRLQCQFPDGADILTTEVGTADGFRVRRDDTKAYFFPGVPTEFRWFVKRYVPPGDEASQPPFKKLLKFFGRGESDLETMIADIADKARSQGVKVGFRASFPIIEVSIRGGEKAGSQLERALTEKIGRWLVAEDDESLMDRLARRLTEGGHTVTVAESCTAGMLAAKLTEVSGSSAYFEEGYLTYSNDAKVRLVGVDEQALVDHGAVSQQVVTQMAAGARRRADSEFALAISGIAGPTGGTEEKPVGTVDFALADADGVFYRRAHFPRRSRDQVRELSVYVAASALLWHLEGRLDEHSWRRMQEGGERR